MVDITAFSTASSNSVSTGPVYTVLLAFLLSTLIAVTYEKTFRGLSYSRNFLQSLVLSAIVAATIMQAIGDSLASGLGMMGALSIIRFRTSFKDPRDIIFMFAALGAGIGCGAKGYDIAVGGTLGFCMVAFILHYSPFGQQSIFDGMLRFNIQGDAGNKSSLAEILKKHCKHFALITLRDMAQGERMEYAYQIKMRKGKEKADLVDALNDLESIKGISLLLQETTVEL